MKLCCPLLPTPQKLSMHSILSAGTLAEPENTTALQKEVLKHYCSSTAPCGSSSLTDSHEVESTCGLVFERSMERLPAQHFPSSSLPVGISLPEHHTRLHTQHLAHVTPPPPAPRKSPLNLSSFVPYFGMWARSSCSCLLGCLVCSFSFFGTTKTKTHRFGIIRK